MASTSSTLPMRVTRTARGTHVVHVRGFSRLQEQHCGVGGFVRSPPFAVAGFDWAVRYYPGSDDDDDDDVGVFVELQTQGAVAWAYVGLLLLDQTTGLADTLIWDEDPTLFDPASRRTWGTYDVAARSALRDSGFVRGDCLKIECAVDVCRDRMAFADPPTRKLAPLHVDAAELLGSAEGADLAIHVGAGEPFTAHTSVLAAYAPGFLKENNVGRRQRRRPKHPTGDTMSRITIVDADMPPSAVEAFLHYIYTDTLPVVAGLTGGAYRAMLRHLLLAGKRYGVPRLAAICERLLCTCTCVDVQTAAEKLAMADRHGFEKLRETCFEFVSDRNNYSFVRESKGYPKMFGAPFELQGEKWPPL